MSRKIAFQLVAVVVMAFAALGVRSDDSANRLMPMFTVERGYLSANIRHLVNGYRWSLIWDSEEDRVIDHPFKINNDNLEDGLYNLLVVYQGAFVADVYRSNQVVRIITPSPSLEIELPTDDQDEQAEPEEQSESDVQDELFDQEVQEAEDDQVYHEALSESEVQDELVDQEVHDRRRRPSGYRGGPRGRQQLAAENHLERTLTYTYRYY